MGIVRSAIGVNDDDEDDRSMEEKVQQKHPITKLLLPITTTTTTPKPIPVTDPADTVYFSGLTWIQISIVVVFAYFIIAMVLIKLCRRNYWKGDSQNIMRSYFTKLATFHLFITGTCFGMYYVLSKRDWYDETTCFFVWQYRWLLICIFPYTILVYALRYMAFGLATSDSFINKGVEMPNPRCRHDIQQGWSADTAMYKSVLGNFYACAMVLFALALITIFVLLPDSEQDALTKISICTPRLQDRYLDHFVFFIMMFLGTNFCAVAVEFLIRERTPDDFFGVALNTPFTTTTAATSWLSWFPVLFYLYYFVDAFAGQYIMCLTYIVILDGTWFSIICALSSVTKRLDQGMIIKP